MHVRLTAMLRLEVLMREVLVIHCRVVVVVLMRRARVLESAGVFVVVVGDVAAARS